jgi:hypothetical protein
MPSKAKGKMGDNPLSVLDVLGGVPTSPASSWDRRHRVTGYRLPPEIAEKVRDVAAREGVPISQVASYALADWLKRYEQGQAKLPTREVVTTGRAVIMPA